MARHYPESEPRVNKIFLDLAFALALACWSVKESSGKGVLMGI